MTSVTGARVLFEDGIAATEIVVLEAQATLAQIDDNLVEVLHGLLSPVYERFDFFQLPPLLVDEEIGRMTRNRF